LLARTAEGGCPYESFALFEKKKAKAADKSVRSTQPSLSRTGEDARLYIEQRAELSREGRLSLQVSFPTRTGLNF
jgi:hypothetical protein